MKSSSRTARPRRAASRPIVIQEGGTIAPEEFTDEDLAFFRGWQPVTEVTGKDIDESARVGRVIKAIPKSCWRNALRVVQKLDDYADASYVEGIACFDGCPLIEHGWVCRSDGTVIDPTLPRRCGAYFPGLEFKGRAGISEFLGAPRGSGCKDSPFFYAFGWGGQYSPSVGQAWQQGWAYLKERWPEAFKDFEPARLTDIWDER
jgi:hypothetical protein